MKYAVEFKYLSKSLCYRFFYRNDTSLLSSLEIKIKGNFFCSVSEGSLARIFGGKLSAIVPNQNRSGSMESNSRLGDTGVKKSQA